MNPRYVLIGLGLLALGGIGGWFAARLGHTPVPATTVTERKVLYWFDPMKPDQHFDKPGKSPFMDMELVPRYADDAVTGAVSIDGRVAQNLALRLAKVEKGALDEGLVASANLVFNERDVAIVQARGNAFVERVYQRAPGDVIAAGAPLADLLLPEWSGAQNEFLALVKTGDATLIAAGRNRLKLLGMPDSLIAEVEKTGRPHAIQTLSAPIAGVIQSLDVRAGMTLTMGMPLARINGIGTLWLEAAVPEAQAGRIRIGQSLLARLGNGEALQGKVIAVLPELNAETRTLRVRAEIPNRKGLLRPGMWAEVHLRGANAGSQLLVPSEAIIRSGTRNLVMLAEDSGRYRPQEVQLGGEAGGKTVILAGLAEGQQIVASGQFLLDSEASLKGVVAAPAATQSPAPAKLGPTTAIGKIEAIKGLEITLSHEAIAAIQWPAMTMPFTLANEHVAHGLKAGDRVRFVFHEADAGYVVEQVEKGGAMIAALIRWSIQNRLLVLLATVMLAAWGVWAVKHTPIDALPDLSDTQVIIRTSYPGQAPQIVENQITYPLSTTMLSVPGAKAVRGFSFFGDSFVYVLFDDGTDLYWARSRVLEYLNQVQDKLPSSAKTALGPDATGVGWIYEYALVDKSGRHDLAELRSLQDWLLRFELKSLPDVAEVASIGGMVRQYQIQLDPQRMAAYRISQNEVMMAVQAANAETGGAVLELAETEFMVRAGGYLKTLDDFRAIVLKAANGTAIRLGDVATIQTGPEMRRGIAELDGQGEVAGGVVLLRSGKNARTALSAIHAKMAELQKNLPQGVEVVTTYDRSQLIDRAVENLWHKLLEEFLVVAVVCALFLWHLRSALVAIIALPLGILAAFVVMHYQGVNANIMSLGGIAIAIGAMIDAAVVMIENAHKKIEHWHHAHPDEKLQGEAHWHLIGEAAAEVGPALFFSLLIITLSFIPIFTLEAQEGRLFGPLAFTKTWAMAAAAGLSVSLIPVLMGYWIRGKIPDETQNPLNRVLIRIYRPLLDWVMAKPKTTLLLALLVFATSIWPLMKLGGEFMPPLDEGDLLYMPSALPGLSAQKAGELLQQTDRLIKTVPEVARVFGKAGRAESATDPAPIEMFETVIQFKPREQWRAGMTPEKLVQELDRTVRVPGLANIWVPPIRNRIDMLATGIKSPIGVKVAGSSLAQIEAVAREIEAVAKTAPGVGSALAERLTGGRYIDVEIDRIAAGRFGLNIADVQAIVSGAIGGMNIGEVVDGLARYPINLRYPRELRDSLEGLRQLPIFTPMGSQITLGTVAKIVVSDGPPMLKSENARPSGWVYVDVQGRDLAAVAHDLQAAVAAKVKLPAGVSVAYSGQFEYMERAAAKLTIVVPATLLIIFVLLYLTFGRMDEAVLIMATLPFALTGGLWFLYLAGYHLSVASGVGFIALAGVAAEFGVVMLIYLRHALDEKHAAGQPHNVATLDAAIREGAVLRVRPKAMTVAVILAGLLPILLGSGTGSEIMSRIAAPMVGGMLSAPLLSMFVLPIAWRILRQRELSTLKETEK